MKRSFIIITAFLMVLSSLFACEKSDGKVTEPLDPAELTEAFSIMDGGMTFRIGIDEARFNFYEDGVYDTVYQSFQHPGVESVELTKSGIRFEDANFDGFTDVLLPQRKLGEIQYYYGYFWVEEEKLFNMNSEILNIGNPVINENSIHGVVEEHGHSYEAEFFYEDGHFVSDHSHHDERMEVALTYMKGFLGKDAIECQFTSWDLVDKSICKKYFVMENGTPIAACAVNADGKRVFYSPLTEAYTEIIFAEESYAEGSESFGRMDHTNEVFTYVAEGYESLTDGEKEIYGNLYSELTEYKAIENITEEQTAPLKAVFLDHPQLYNFYRFEERHGMAEVSLYCKWAPYKTPEASELAKAVSEYSAFTDEIINSIPVGLEPLEKYLYLAQRLQLMVKEHEGKDIPFELLISADSNGEKLSRTYKHLCEKAQLYCTYEGSTNTILVNGEKITVSIEKTSNNVPGSDKWQSAFFME